MSVEQALKMSSMFQGVSDEDLALVVPMCLEEVTNKGAEILTQGEHARFLYLVDMGRVSLHMNMERPDGSSTGQITVASIGTREAFSWSSLVPPYISTLSATSVEASRLTAIEGTTLVELFSKHRDLGYLVMVNVANLIAERLAEIREAFVYDRSYVHYLERQSKNLE